MPLFRTKTIGYPHNEYFVGKVNDMEADDWEVKDVVPEVKDGDTVGWIVIYEKEDEDDNPMTPFGWGPTITVETTQGSYVSPEEFMGPAISSARGIRVDPGKFTGIVEHNTEGDFFDDTGD